MKNISIGKFSGLQSCVSSGGFFICLAIDHRQNLKRSLHPNNPNATTEKELQEFKLTICKNLSCSSTAVLLDPEYSAAQAISKNAISKGVGLIVALEATGYTGNTKERRSQILNNWSVEKAKMMGADAVKLLVYYHPESSTAGEIEELVVRIAEQCQNYDIALIVEPLTYPLGKFSDKTKVVIETVKRLSPLGPDIIKIEFPFDKDNDDKESWEFAFRRITSVSDIPWILLSAGVPFNTYLDWVRTACECGASGVAVGRAIWNEAINMKGLERENFLKLNGKARLSDLYDVCNDKARSVYELFYSDTPPTWYQSYLD